MSALKEIMKRALRLPANALIGSSSNLANKVDERLKDTVGPLTLEQPAFAAKFLPYQGGMRDYILRPLTDPATTANEGLPIPPKDLWQGYAASPELFVQGARTDVKAMRDILDQSDFPIQAGYRILDLGCGAGRMIRMFVDIAERCEVWGVDIVAEYIIWCQQHLSPPFHFATTTTLPHLPFEDRYFDFIYCGSVFSHIADLADAWLLELRRVTRPNGRLFITLHDNNSIKILREQNKRWPWLSGMVQEFVGRTDVTDRKFSMFTINRGPSSAQVFYDIDYVCQHWGRLFRIRSVTPAAHGYQTAILLER